ncbi:unnamed protein product [Ilex paraguariensis]|uniref:Uncharacterized protein n=1 Tax=Ilex paraguariensis TaxID=185542 RepID=A0ABC8QYZ7_9AQUA
MGDKIDLGDQEEEEETLSLSNLPLATHEPNAKDFSRLKERRSSSQPTDFFEFFSDLNAEMSHAEDIIFCGKLIPLQEQSLPNITHKPPTGEDRKPQSFCRRRSESSPELKTSSSTSRSNSTKTIQMRSSRSLDYQKLRRNSSLSSDTSEIHRNSSVKRSEKFEFWGIKLLKPRWHALMFGLVKFPPEMDLRDMKNRQFRRNPGTMFTMPDAGKKVPVRRSDRKSSWGLLRVLGCVDHSSVEITASFGCMPQG